MSKTREVIHLASIASNSDNVRRITSLCKEFDFNYRQYQSVDEVLDIFPQVLFVTLFLEHERDLKKMTNMISKTKELFPSAFILPITKVQLTEDMLIDFRDHGASAVILEEELYTSSKLEYFTSQIIRTTFLPIKAVDILPGSIVPFNLYTLLEVNKRFVKLYGDGGVIDKDRHERYKKHGTEWFIRRQDIGLYKKYLEEYRPSGNTMESECRYAYLQLKVDFMNLVIILTDSSTLGSYADGKKLLERCEKSAANLVDVVTKIKNIDDVLERTSFMDFGSIERTPGLVLTVGSYAHKLGLSDLNDLIFSTLISDIGFIRLPYDVNRKIKSGVLNFNEQEEALYESHPRASINILLNRKLPLSDRIKEIVLSTHERSDKKGFPMRIAPERIPLESQIIQFFYQVDQNIQVRPGELFKDREEETKRIINNWSWGGVITLPALNKIKKALFPADDEVAA